MAKQKFWATRTNSNKKICKDQLSIEGNTTNGRKGKQMENFHRFLFPSSLTPHNWGLIGEEKYR